MAFDLGKFLKGAVAQINPFDNGQTSVMKARPASTATPKIVKPQFNLGKTVGDIAGGVGNFAWKNIIEPTVNPSARIYDQLDANLTKASQKNTDLLKTGKITRQQHTDTTNKISQARNKIANQAGQTENIIRSVTSPVRNVAQGIVQSVPKTAGSLVELAGNVGQWATPSGKTENFFKGVSKFGQNIGGTSDKLATNVFQTKNDNQVVKDIGQSGGELLTDIATGKIALKGTGALKYADDASRLQKLAKTSSAVNNLISGKYATRVFNDTYNTAKQAGKSDEQAGITATTNAVIQGLIERVSGVGKYLDKVSTGVISKIVTNGLKEGGEEGLQQLTDNIAKMTINPPTDHLDFQNKLFANVGQSFGYGALMGSAASGATINTDKNVTRPTAAEVPGGTPESKLISKLPITKTMNKVPIIGDVANYKILENKAWSMSDKDLDLLERYGQPKDFTDTTTPQEYNRTKKLIKSIGGEQNIQKVLGINRGNYVDFQKPSLLDNINKSGILGNTITDVSKEVPAITPEVGKTDPLSQLKQEALKYKSAEEFVKAQFNKPSYGMSHRPTQGPPAYDLLSKVDGDSFAPRDIYEHPEYYGDGGNSLSDKQSIEAIKSIKNKPNATVTIYRASPKNELNSGDWVTLSENYAKQESLSENTPVNSFKVKASDIKWAGDSINEFGYYPTSQLTDIWNKANKKKISQSGSLNIGKIAEDLGLLKEEVPAITPEVGKNSLIQEAKKYKSADEFVKDNFDNIKITHSGNSQSVKTLWWKDGSIEIRVPKNRKIKDTDIWHEIGHIIDDSNYTGGKISSVASSTGGKYATKFDKEFSEFSDFLIERRPKMKYEGKSYYTLDDIAKSKYSQREKDYLVNEFNKVVGGKTAYYSQNIELFAEAFAHYANDKGLLRKMNPKLADLMDKIADEEPLLKKLYNQTTPSPQVTKTVPAITPPLTQREINQGIADGLLPKGTKAETPTITPQKQELPIVGKPITKKLQTRGFTESVKTTPEVAPEVKKSVEGLYTPKTNDTLMGEAKALLTDGGQIDFKATKDLDKKVAATMQEAMNQQAAGNYQAAADLYNNLAEHGTELGRGVQAFSLLKNMSPEAVSLSVAGRIKKFNRDNPTRKIPELNEQQMRVISEKVQAADLLTGREKNIALHELEQTVSDFIPSTVGDKALAVWKAGLLTSFRTHARNFVGNTIHGIAEIAKDVPGSLADTALSKKTGKRTLVANIKGTGEFASKNTRQQMADIITKGYDPTSMVDKFDYKKITWGKNPLEQGLKKYTDIVFNTLAAEDKPFYNAAMARSLYNQASAEAINVGKRGDKTFIENLVKNPTEEMTKTAIGDANVATFKDRNKANEIVSALKRQMGKNEVTKVIGEVTMPFTGVPTSILGQVTAYSPIGLVKGMKNAIKVNKDNAVDLQRKAAQEIGRGVIGTGIYALGAYLSSQGLITGQPKDAEEAKQWELENKPRNSIMIGGKWRSLNSIGPEAIVFLAGSKLQQEMSKEDASLANYAVTIGKDYLDQSFVQGLQSPVNAITDPNRYATSYGGQLLSSFEPNILKDLAKSQDPYQREMNTVTDYAKGNIPGLRNTMTVKRDVLGNEIKQEPTGVGAFVDLFNSKTPVSNTVVNELDRLYQAGYSATPSKLSKSQTIGGEKVKLTPEQLDKLEATSGKAVSEQMNQLINTPEYQSATDEVKKKTLDNLVEDIRKSAKNATATGTTLTVSKASKKAQLELAKSAFDASGENYQIVGDTVLRRSADGTITATPKTKFESQIRTQQLEQYKNNEDVTNWMVTAEEQAKSLISQLQDPSIDPLDAITIQNDLNTLMGNIVKYKGYGGFTKPKSTERTKNTIDSFADIYNTSDLGALRKLVQGTSTIKRKVIK